MFDCVLSIYNKEWWWWWVWTGLKI